MKLQVENLTIYVTLIRVYEELIKLEKKQSFS